MTFMAASAPWPHSSTSQVEVKYWMSKEGIATASSPGPRSSSVTEVEDVGVRKTTMGWLKPFTNLRRSSWVSVVDLSRKITVAGFPPNGSWVNAFAIANGYDLVGVGDVEDMKGLDGVEDVKVPQLPLGGYLKY